MRADEFTNQLMLLVNFYTGICGKRYELITTHTQNKTHTVIAIKCAGWVDEVDMKLQV